MCHVARHGGLLITLRGVPRRAGSEPARLSESGYAALVVVDPRLKTDAVALRPRPAGLP